MSSEPAAPRGAACSYESAAAGASTAGQTYPEIGPGDHSRRPREQHAARGCRVPCEASSLAWWHAQCGR
eukprot:2662028-Prymnesium_polylepis.3